MKNGRRRSINYMYDNSLNECSKKDFPNSSVAACLNRQATYIVDGLPIRIVCLRLCEKSPNICVFVLG